MDRPLIGVTSYLVPARWGPWDKPAVLVPHGYTAAIADVGGVAVVIPPNPEGIDETLDCLAGLVFCGGPDIHPSEHDPGADATPAVALEHERDAAELVLLRAAVARDLPVLGICRGLQLINLAYGGTLIGHLPDVLGHDEHRRREGEFNLHPVDVDPDTTVGRVLGGRVMVHSAHHQGIERLADGLVRSGWAPDGTIEAIEDPSRRFAVGVLWHPEESDDRRLFAALLDAARSTALRT